MQYTLELNSHERGSNVVFNTILLNSFKVNIVERYSENRVGKLQLREVLFKVRTPDDQIFQKKDGTVNTYIRGDDFSKYQKLTKIFSSLRYRNKLINIKEAEQDFVHFILTFVIVNYEFA